MRRPQASRKGATVTITLPCNDVEMAQEVIAAFEELWGNIGTSRASCLQALLERGEQCECCTPVLAGKFAQLCRPKFELSAKGLVALLDERERVPRRERSLE